MFTESRGPTVSLNASAFHFLSCPLSASIVTLHSRHAPTHGSELPTDGTNQTEDRGKESCSLLKFGLTCSGFCYRRGGCPLCCWSQGIPSPVRSPLFRLIPDPTSPRPTSSRIVQAGGFGAACARPGTAVLSFFPLLLVTKVPVEKKKFAQSPEHPTWLVVPIAIPQPKMQVLVHRSLVVHYLTGKHLLSSDFLLEYWLLGYPQSCGGI